MFKIRERRLSVQSVTFCSAIDSTEDLLRINVTPFDKIVLPGARIVGAAVTGFRFFCGFFFVVCFFVFFTLVKQKKKSSVRVYETLTLSPKVLTYQPLLLLMEIKHLLWICP